MNEGRSELQSVILQYEKQRAEAIRSKQESEIVLPFLRAALEELDDALGQRERDVSDEDVQSRMKKAAPVAADEGDDSQGSGSRFRFEAASRDSGGEEKAGEDREDEPSFGRGSIAALLDEEEGERTGTR